MMTHAKESFAPLLLSSPLNLTWCVAFEKSAGELYRIHVIGPCFTSEPSLHEISSVLQNSPITDHWKPKFLAILQRIPVVSSSTLFQHALMLHFCVSGEKLQISDIVLQHTESSSSSDAASSKSSERKDRMNVYRAEQAMLRMVREGDISLQDALAVAASVSTGAQIMEGSALVRSKVSQIIFITMCSRAAIEAVFLLKFPIAAATPIFRMCWIVKRSQMPQRSVTQCIRISFSSSTNVVQIPIIANISRAVATISKVMSPKSSPLIFLLHALVILDIIFRADLRRKWVSASTHI